MCSLTISVVPGPPTTWQLRRRDGGGQVDFPLEIRVRHDLSVLTQALYACLADGFGNATVLPAAYRAPQVVPVEALPDRIKIQRKRLVRSKDPVGGGTAFEFDSVFGITGNFGQNHALNFKIAEPAGGAGGLDSEPFIVRLQAGDLSVLKLSPEGDTVANGGNARLLVRGEDEYGNVAPLVPPVSITSAAVTLSGAQFTADAEDPCSGQLIVDVIAPDEGHFDCVVHSGEASAYERSVVYDEYE